MRINNNIMAMNTFRQYSINTSNSANSTEKLSSGYRINRAGDDAAGLAISEKMRAQIRGLNMASKNSQDAISLVQTAEGALTETHSILQRMRELATQSASDTNDSDVVDRDALNEEFQALKSEINDIANKTAFNGKKLLDGSFGQTSAVDYVDAATTLDQGQNGITKISVSGFTTSETVSVAYAAGTGDYSMTRTVNGVAETMTINESVLGATTGGTLSFSFSDGASVTIEGVAEATAGDWAGDLAIDVTGAGATIQTGANAGDELQISIDKMDASALGLNSYSAAAAAKGGANAGDAIDLLTQNNASSAIDSVNTAINTVSTQRSKLGAYQNRLQHKINNLDTSSENLSAAESRIRDLDMAKEMTTYTKNNILVQAATAMLAQANSAPQGVLQLLQ
jgi:flagellin